MQLDFTVNKANAIIIALLCIVLVIVIIVKIWKEHIEDNRINNKLLADTMQKSIEKQNNKLALDFRIYVELFECFRNAIQYMSTIKEINILIDKCAEVSPMLIKDSDNTYTSFDNLLIWKESYMMQLETYYIVVKNMYSAFSHYLSEDVKEVYKTKLYNIGAFIESQNKGE